MSDVKPYVPGQTGSLSDVIERGPELGPVTPAGPDGFAAPPSWSQLFTAARPEALRSTPLYDDVKIGEGYAPIVDALGLPASENPGYFGDLDAGGQARFGYGGSLSRLATTARQGEQVPFSSQYLANRSLQESLVISQIKARRLVDKNFLPGVPDDAEGLHQYFEQQQAAKRASGASVLARGSTFGRTTASIAAGGLESALHDPITLPTLVIGGGTASSLVLAAGRDALINGVLAAAEQPIVAQNMAENDEHLTIGDVASSVASSAVFGAAVGGTVHLATHIPPALFHIMPESVQTRWAGRMRVGAGENAPLLKDVLSDMDNRELATFSRSAIGPDRMTPDEKAAATVIERNQEIGEASPFEPGPMGDAAHNANIADALQGVIDGAPRETLPGAAPLLASTSPIAMRPPAPVAAHGADFETQWTAIKGNEHGIGSHGEFLTSKAGAIGPGQVMPGTAPHAAQLAGVPFDDHLYRTDAAYNEKLGRAYYAEQLQTFGDPEMAAAAYNAGPGSAARGTGLRGALRKAAEHGEPGNWRAYLPHETQKYVEDFRRRSGASPEAYQAGQLVAGTSDDEAIAALQRSADQAEAEGLALSREQQDLGAADLTRARADVADVPVLKRDLFPGDECWADAQAAFHRSLNGPEEPAGAPPSGESEAGPAGQPVSIHAPEAVPGSSVPTAAEALSRAADDHVQLVESLEHDIRMEARAATARAADAVLRSSQASGKLPRSPKSLLDFVASRGGIEDVGGDLSAMNIERWHLEKPFRRKLLRDRPHHAEPGIAYSKNNAPDQLFQAAIDANYFPEFNRTRVGGAKYEHLPDINSFYNAIDEELRGSPRYSSEDQAAVFDRARADENNAWIADKLDRLQELAAEQEIGLDEGALLHAVDEIARGSTPEEALHTAVQAAAMRDLATAVADTGDLRYGMDNSGRSWDDEVNYAENRDPAANDRTSRPGERRSTAQAADQAPGRTVAGEPQSAAEGAGLERRYRLAPDSEPQSLKEILDELDRERDGVAALRNCAEFGGGE